MVRENNLAPTVQLNNGITMPLLGLGVYDMYGKEAESAVHHALEIGYRLIDTASMYRNETETGQAVRGSGLPREDIFVTTKVGNGDQGFDSTLRAFDVSLKKLQLNYIDLYLVHWPIKKTRKETWKALEKLYADGKVKAIGVANYLEPFFEEMKTYSDIVPAVNQVEFTPYLYSRSLLDYCRRGAIQLQAYSPLVRGKKMSDPRLVELSRKYGKTPAQILLRWNIDLGICPIPKSSKEDRLLENFDVFGFSLDAADLEDMKTWFDGTRVADDPMNLL